MARRNFWLLYFLVAALAPVAGVGAAAESFTLASVSHEIVPTAELQLSGLEEDELNTSATTTTVKLAIPVFLSGRDTMLLNFITLRNLHQTYEDAPSGADIFRPEDLYTFKYGLVFRQTLSDRWAMFTLLQPALLSDLEDVDSDHFSLRAGFVFEKTHSPNLTYGFGLGYSDDFGGQAVLPVIRLKWKVSPAWKLKLDVPQKLELWRRSGPNARLGVTARVTGGGFRIGQIADLPDGRSAQGGFVKYSILNVGPAAEFPLRSGLSVTINAGTSIFRRYEVVDVDDRTLIDSDFESSLFLKTTLSLAVGD